MSPPEIPYVAEQAGCAAIKIDPLSVSGHRYRVVIAAAAPLIVAANYRSLLAKLEAMRQEMLPEDDRALQAVGLGDGLIRDQIAELDPQGLTR